MRSAMRPRYYCDHCNKGNGSPSAMRRHESGCTKNPQRVCRMCVQRVEMFGSDPQVSFTELLSALDADGFPAMAKLASDCPACILAVLRARTGFDPESGYYVTGPYEDGRNAWSYKTAKERFWTEHNDAAYEREQARQDAYY